jgi:hypothetical protein
MSDTQEEISTTPEPGAISAALGNSVSTLPRSLAWLPALPLFAKPLTAWALLGLAGTRLLPPLWESIQIGVEFLRSGCACTWGPWIPSLIYTALTALCINPKTIREAGGVVGAVTSLVGAIRGAKK